METEAFMADPIIFLTQRPLLINVPLDTNLGIEPGHFTVQADSMLVNPQSSQKPCALEIDQSNSSPLLAYWCSYEPDRATQLTVGAGANFMFTANMDGCSFLIKRDTTGSVIVSHSNAASIGMSMHGAMRGKGPATSSVFQKTMQEQMGFAKLGGSQDVVTHHSQSGECTTVVGVRETGSGAWKFYKQVISVDSSGINVSVKTLTEM
ncbi:MAG TPA: hypothetical protein VF179_33135 [Thermoanaerobaculia bacterium]|nr:hypothetical protein [Thermoanaerobaculia bacterium]